MSTTATISERRYRAIRAEAIAAIAETIVRDGSVDDLAVNGAVRAWMEDHYEERLGRFDPSVVESVVPTDPDGVDTPASNPLSSQGGDEHGRRELYAARAVRADLTAVLRSQSGHLRRAIAVHDALERLVGERGDRTDRRPSGIVAAFAEWVEGERGEAAADRARQAFTPLHVMRIDALDVVAPDGEAADRGLLRALEAWLSAAHPEELDSGPGASGRGSVDE